MCSNVEKVWFDGVSRKDLLGRAVSMGLAGICVEVLQISRRCLQRFGRFGDLSGMGEGVNAVSIISGGVSEDSDVTLAIVMASLTLADHALVVAQWFFFSLLDTSDVQNLQTCHADFLLPRSPCGCYLLLAKESGRYADKVAGSPSIYARGCQSPPASPS